MNLLKVCNTAARGVKDDDPAYEVDDHAQDAWLFLTAHPEGIKMVRTSLTKDSPEAYLIACVRRYLQGEVKARKPQPRRQARNRDVQAQYDYRPSFIRTLLPIALDPQGTVGTSASPEPDRVSGDTGRAPGAAASSLQDSVIDIRRAIALADPLTKQVLQDYYEHEGQKVLDGNGRPISWLQSIYGPNWSTVVLDACRVLAEILQGNGARH